MGLIVDYDGYLALDERVIEDARLLWDGEDVASARLAQANKGRRR